jgi:OPA family sugar phosphate sensor protein UhpC-like MFS transporter
VSGCRIALVGQPLYAARVQATAAQRRRIFLLTWLAYGAYYLCRRPFAIGKATIAAAYHLNEHTLGLIDTGYLVAYAAGQFASGLLADRVGARRLVGYGMLAVAASSVAFGAGNFAAAFAIAFTINGLFQATGWPGVVKAMTAMYEPAERGTVMGWWATSYQVGGVAATAMATWLLVHIGWRAAFFVPAAFTAAIGVAVLLWLWEPPLAPVVERREMSLAIVRDPLVWALGAAYFCVKLIRYCIVFWLPYFYERRLHYSSERAGYLSISFELGGVAGAILGGRLFDQTGPRRGWLIVALTFGLAIASLVYPQVATAGPVAAFGGMVAIGFMLFGPDALVSSVAAQDLGGPEAAGTAAGFINGVGSVGAILQGVITASVAAQYGWDAMFYVFFGLSMLAMLAVVPYAIAAKTRNQGSA